jgi:anaerobic ribonucleoside-triphosphate reductase activating protein
MLKYLETQITFSEIPDEVTLCINITGCPNRCINCHSPHLTEDIGELLDLQHLTELINANKGITCVCIMGGDKFPSEVDNIAQDIKKYYPNLKVGWYSGNDVLSKDVHLCFFDYVKIGSYKENLGPLNKKTTNQKMYKVVHTSSGKDKLIDITHKFWKA